MKKITNKLKSEADFVPRPFALLGHDHAGVYLPVNQATGVVEVSTNIVFTGTLTGISPTESPSFIAGENLSALRVISSNNSGQAVYSDPADTDSVRRIIGLTISAGLSGQAVTVLLEGKHSDSGWSFDVTKRLFLGANGTITQVAPTTGNSVVLGHAQTPTTIIFDPEKPIALV